VGLKDGVFVVGSLVGLGDGIEEGADVGNNVVGNAVGLGEGIIVGTTGS